MCPVLLVEFKNTWKKLNLKKIEFLNLITPPIQPILSSKPAIAKIYIRAKSFII